MIDIRVSTVRRAGFLCVSLIVVALGAPGALRAEALPSAPRGTDDEQSKKALLAELRTESDRTARLTTRGPDADLTFIGASSAHPLQPASDDDTSDIASGFLGRYGALFGVTDAATTLDEVRSFSGGSGDAVRYQQSFAGIPVIAGEIAVQIDPNGAVVSASGEVATDLELDVVAAITGAQAAETARALVARNEQVAAADLVVTEPELWVYDPTLIGAPDPLGPRLVWRFEVRTALGDVNRFVLVDAHDGTIAFQFSQVAHAKDREVCDNNNNTLLAENCTSPVRSEGDAPVGSAEANSAYDLSGLTYDFFFDNFGRDSLDGSGMTLKSTVRYCDPSDSCPYANAFWSGTQMVYGQGYASADDVVGHELTHGLTDFTSDLFYYSESGAINESLSDVMGELIDQSSTLSGVDLAADKWLMGEQLPIGAIRSMKDPPAFSDPDRMTSALFFGGLNDSRGVHFNSGVNNKAAFLITDGGTFNGQTVLPLGIIKTAKIYYQVETTLLGPGSDYLDLSVMLPQACTNLVGTAGITATDCQQVSKAVLATEMNFRPTTPGAHLFAPLCSSGTQNAIHFVDDMETNSADWSTTATGGMQPWSYFVGSSQSGTRSFRVVDAPGPEGLSTLELLRPTPIPAGATFLRFDHSFSTDFAGSTLYDGGVVEFTTNNGTNWTDISTLPGTVNGYNDTLDTGFSNPLGGRPAFGTLSPSYQQTRITLSSLAGQTVRFRFRFATDNSFGAPGWFIDDVKIYSCGAAQAPAAPRNAVATAVNLTASLSWSVPLFDGGSAITGYTITPFIGAVAQVAVDTPTAATAFVVSDLLPGAAYTFQIAARNAVGTGPPSVASAPITFVDYIPLAPARLLETRPDSATIDGQFNNIGIRAAGTTTEVQITGRATIPANATAVVLNIAVTQTQAPGFITVFPCGSPRPETSSNLNYTTNQTIPNLVIAKIGDNGKICIFTLADTHIIADLNGYYPG